MRLLVIDVAFVIEAPPPQQLVDSLQRSLVGGIAIDHMFVVSPDDTTRSCCFFVPDDSVTAADAAMITRRALASEAAFGPWTVTRVREAR
ncbi:hypothetical protein [Glycomyces rhizosphaerae]|uniref:DUF4242 domain-containing protein n=1 Tax=Glycomyces rhizosphaerae TaxID=2054422 RepID=A0ABV7Q8G7_9ACTN